LKVNSQPPTLVTQNINTLIVYVTACMLVTPNIYLLKLLLSFLKSFSIFYLIFRVQVPVEVLLTEGVDFDVVRDLVVVVSVVVGVGNVAVGVGECRRPSFSNFDLLLHAPV
jgi:hypothetical protein